MPRKTNADEAHTPASVPLPPGSIDFDELVASAKRGEDLSVTVAAMVAPPAVEQPMIDQETMAPPPAETGTED